MIAWDKTLLVVDVWGTNARFALAHMVEGKPVLEHFDSFPAERHPTFLEGVKAFIDGCEVKPTGGVIAVAGPVEDGAIDLTNSPWAVSETELSTLGLKPVRLINDFEALAWGAASSRRPISFTSAGPRSAIRTRRWRCSAPARALASPP